MDRYPIEQSDIDAARVKVRERQAQQSRERLQDEQRKSLDRLPNRAVAEVDYAIANDKE